MWACVGMFIASEFESHVHVIDDLGSDVILWVTIGTGKSNDASMVIVSPSGR